MQLNLEERVSQWVSSLQGASNQLQQSHSGLWPLGKSTEGGQKVFPWGSELHRVKRDLTARPTCSGGNGPYLSSGVLRNCCVASRVEYLPDDKISSCTTINKGKHDAKN